MPDKRFSPFDGKRPVTILEHLYRDHEEGPAWSYLDHVKEYAEHWNFTGEPHKEYVSKLVETNYSIHFHVWTQDNFLGFLVHIRRRLSLPFTIEAAISNNVLGETVTVLRKSNELTPEGNGNARRRSVRLSQAAAGAIPGLRRKTFDVAQIEVVLTTLLAHPDRRFEHELLGLTTGERS